MLIRDAETKTLLHSFANPRFQATGLQPGLIRIRPVRDRAINAFASSGNRMFPLTVLLEQVVVPPEMIAAMTRETGRVAHRDISRIPELERQALGSLLIGAAGDGSGDPAVGGGSMVDDTWLAEWRFLSFPRTRNEDALDISYTVRKENRS